MIRESSRPPVARAAAFAAAVIAMVAWSPALAVLPCEVETYPADGGEMQGDVAYAFITGRRRIDISGYCWAFVRSVSTEEETIEFVEGDDSSGYSWTRFPEIIVGETYEAEILVRKSYGDHFEDGEFTTTFSVAPLGDTVDTSTLEIDLAEAVVIERGPIRVTIEGRWRGANEHHLLVLGTHGHYPVMVHPDPDDDGAFRIDYDHFPLDSNRRRNFSLTGGLRAISPTNPGNGERIEMRLIEDVDLRLGGCGCTTAPRAAAWPLLALGLLVRRRRTTGRPAPSEAP